MLFSKREGKKGMKIPNLISYIILSSYKLEDNERIKIKIIILFTTSSIKLVTRLFFPKLERVKYYESREFTTSFYLIFHFIKQPQILFLSLKSPLLLYSSPFFSTNYKDTNRNNLNIKMSFVCAIKLTRLEM